MCRIVKTTRRVIKREKGIITKSYGGFHAPTWRVILIPLAVALVGFTYIAIEAASR